MFIPLGCTHFTHLPTPRHYVFPLIHALISHSCLLHFSFIPPLLHPISPSTLSLYLTLHSTHSLFSISDTLSSPFHLTFCHPNPPHLYPHITCQVLSPQSPPQHLFSNFHTLTPVSLKGPSPKCCLFIPSRSAA